MAKKNTKTNFKLNGFKNMSARTRALLIVVVIAVAGVITLRLTSAASYDGYQRVRVVNTAASQIGNREWNGQVLAYSEGNRENWCADFVSWVYLQSGYAFSSPGAAGRSSWRIPIVYMKHNTVPNLRDYLSIRGAYKTKESGYVPGPGDIIIFARGGRSHTGIVENVSSISGKGVEGTFINTIEGNTSTQDVARRSYPMNDGTIDGYGTILSVAPAGTGKNP